MLVASALTLLAAVGSAVAAPRPSPQDIDFADIVDDLPPVSTVSAIPLAATATATSVVVNSASAFSAISSDASIAATSLAAEATASADERRKRGMINYNPVVIPAGCAKWAAGYGPVDPLGSASDFVASPTLSSIAANAPVPTSSTADGASYKQVFSNLKGEVNAKNWYAFKTLTTYDTQACASWCDSKVNCLGFNILFERDATYDPGCYPGGNPPATNQIKCVLHGFSLSSGDATNTGQWQNKFQVVVAGSNGYLKPYGNAPAEAGYKGQKLANGHCSIQAGLDNGVDTYLGYQIVSNVPFDPKYCTDACTTQTKYDHDTANGGLYKTCNYVVASMLNKVSNGITTPQGMICTKYAKDWSATADSIATNCPSGSQTLDSTFGYALNPEQRTDLPAANP